MRGSIPVTQTRPVPPDVSIATYSDYDDFLYRLPLYVADIDRRMVARLRQAEEADGRVGEGRRRLAASRGKQANQTTHMQDRVVLDRWMDNE